MRPVAVRILHPEPGLDAGPLTRRLTEARSRVAERHRRGFLAAGAADVEIVSGPADERSFGDRLRGLLDGQRSGGMVVLGSGAIPLATAADRRAFVAAAAGDEGTALANNRYSADVVAISRVEMLPGIPDLPGDNALPRWLEEVAGYRVADLRRRWRLGFDLDGPLDMVLLGLSADARRRDDARVTTMAEDRLAAVRTVATDRRAELLVSGRTSASTIGWLERHSAARVRAWVEERGLRAASRRAQASDPAGAGERGGATGREVPDRAPASILGLVLDRDGPGSLAKHLARFADAAIVDSRVLLAHRLGAEEAGWPSAEDRFASDMLLADAVADPWLRELTTSAATAPIPILLGGHTLVGPGVRLVVGGPPRGLGWR